jgi:sodium transport system permease protein
MLSMRWANVLLIFRREVRDQLRDRRTLFMIFILPILLYPILGFAIAHLAEAFEQKPRRVIVLGAEHLPEAPRLLNVGRNGFERSLFEIPDDAGRLQVRIAERGSRWDDPVHRRERLRADEADAVIEIPADVRAQLQSLQRARISIYYDGADEQSQTTYLRVDKLLTRWNELIVQERLKRDAKPAAYVEPVRAVARDVARREEIGGSVWARLFPFLLVMMALTGAFYPAVDLCAGEKERGTMETLLISPATRPEIVVGKFLTVMLASMMTALLNLLSMGVTAHQFFRQLGGPAGGRATARGAELLSTPGLVANLWMIVLLVPLAAFFSALCLSLAVLARSMKEGQYYMTPLYLVALPLVFATLAPGIELNLFTSLVPITGVSLLLKALMQEDYAIARKFFLPVVVPLGVYGAVALHWAVDQFQREAVLFREAERVDMGAWLRHLVRDRTPTPTSGAALFCFALMISTAWFLFPFISGTATGLVLGQAAFVLGIPLLLTLVLTASPRETLLLRWPKPRHVAIAVGLVLALNPLAAELRVMVERLFPVSELIKPILAKLMASLPNFGVAFVVLALVPGICEEVAFRGFILSGLKRDYRVSSAILLSAFLFGFLHVLLSLFQQLFNSTLLGIVLGLLAVRSRSLLPGIVFHVINNGLALGLGVIAESGGSWPIVGVIFRDPAQGLYYWYWVTLGCLAAATLLWFLARNDGAEPAEKRALVPRYQPGSMASSS